MSTVNTVLYEHWASVAGAVCVNNLA